MKDAKKSLKLLKSLSTGALTLGLIAAPLTFSASAQVDPAVPQERVVYQENTGFDWGLLGLLGLIGLAGLAGKKRQDDARAYREPESTTRY